MDELLPIESAFGSLHWTHGGDALTNFSAPDFQIYREAIRRHGDASLYIGKPTPNGNARDFALRQVGRPDKRCDLTVFWAIFNEVRAEHNAAMQAARSAS